jgi:cell division septum initiation protein DivIVA
MISEKEILHQMLGREIDNLLRSFNPMLGMFSGTAKQYVFDFLDPYIDAFVSPQTNKINTEAAGEFIKEEVDEKIKNFMKKFDSERNKNNGPKDYIV